MISHRIRRALAILALTAASVMFPLSDLSAAPRSESRWNGPQRTPFSQSFSFWNTVVSLFERVGLRIDGNG
ncbi:MAG TPA: hypothetical protein VN493_31405 [Thermoanaerobaculia bacterium]|nr:hypothetical protein [Thermoanaerobaculia bacterium]